MSAATEMAEVDKRIKRWVGAFPEMYLCLGNHDRLIHRQAQTIGIPTRAIKSFREMWNLPIGWKEDFSWEFYGVRFMHGTGLSGEKAHIKAANANRTSTVIGHTHSVLGGDYLVSEKDRIFGMNVGCGLDRHRYAFNYGKDLLKKPALGCGVITDRGKYWQVFAMDL